MLCDRIESYGEYRLRAAIMYVFTIRYTGWLVTVVKGVILGEKEVENIE